MPKGIYPRKDPWVTVYKRFFSKIKKDGKCWIWTASKDKNGYGKIMMGEGKPFLATHISFIIHKGEIPKGLIIMHSCDNPPCVNPKHLEAGTYSQNLIDAYKRGLHKPRSKEK